MFEIVVGLMEASIFFHIVAIFAISNLLYFFIFLNRILSGFLRLFCSVLDLIGIEKKVCSHLMVSK